MPDDVAVRMDRVLAGLTGAPAAVPPEPVGARDAEAVPIAAHRRRRAAGLLVAAAAIVVGGFTVAQNPPPTGPSGGSTTNAAEDRSKPESDRNLHTSPPDNSEGFPPGLLHHGRVLVRPRHFTDDALEGRRLLGLDPPLAQDFVRPCTDPADQARALPAEYRHVRAALVFRRPEGGSQVVDLFLCGTPQPVRSTRLPAP